VCDRGFGSRQTPEPTEHLPGREGLPHNPQSCLHAEGFLTASEGRTALTSASELATCSLSLSKGQVPNLLAGRATTSRLSWFQELQADPLQPGLSDPLPRTLPVLTSHHRPGRETASWLGSQLHKRDFGDSKGSWLCLGTPAPALESKGVSDPSSKAGGASGHLHGKAGILARERDPVLGQAADEARAGCKLRFNPTP